MALVKALTFESGSVTGADAFDTVAGTISIESTTPILGTHSVKSGQNGASGRVNFTAVDSASFSVYVRIDSHTSGNVVIMYSGNSIVAAISIDANRRLKLSGNGSDHTPLDVGTVYRIDCIYRNITPTGTARRYLAFAEGNGAATVIYDNADAVTLGVSNVRAGFTLGNVLDELHIANDETIPILPNLITGQELAARMVFAVDIAPDIEITRTLAARLVMGIEQRGDIHVARGKELAARLVFAVDMRPAIQAERQLAARLVVGVDTRADPQVGAPGQQLAARLVLGLGIQPDTLQVTRTLSVRLVFGLDTAAALLVTRQLAARLVMSMDLREGYTGPGTGLVVSGVRDPLATLREGDTFIIFLPWGGLQGTSGLAHVNSRRVSDDRDEQELELAIIPNDPANVPQLATGATPTPTADGQDLARKQARQAREIDKLERNRSR